MNVCVVCVVYVGVRCTCVWYVCVWYMVGGWRVCGVCGMWCVCGICGVCISDVHCVCVVYVFVGIYICMMCSYCMCV